MRRPSQDPQSTSWATSGTDLTKILRDVERAGSLALDTEQETGSFGLIGAISSDGNA
jgi:hypothetical protein